VVADSYRGVPWLAVNIGLMGYSRAAANQSVTKS
jgi:hypothetical protein